MKKINNELREKIQSYIKNGKDISELLVGYTLSGENLSNSIIKKFNRYNEDLHGCMFVNCIIGKLGTETNLSGCNFEGTNFKGARFLGHTNFKNNNAKKCNFNDADLNSWNYSGSDFRGASFCEAITKIGSMCGHGAIFDKSILDLLTKGWIIK